MSSADVIGRLAVLEWDGADEITNTAAKKLSDLGEEENQNVPTSNPNFIRRAKQDPSASPYTKVLCKFSNGEYEVLDFHPAICIRKIYIRESE
jgi:hypothetical protein